MPKAAKQHRKPQVGKQHVRSVKYQPREIREHSTARGYGKRWAKFRKSFLSANPLCEYCKASGVVKSSTVCDHDLPHGGDMEIFWDNTFTALCKQCHDSAKKRMEAKYSDSALLSAIKDAKQGW